METKKEITDPNIITTILNKLADKAFRSEIYSVKISLKYYFDREKFHILSKYFYDDIGFIEIEYKSNIEEIFSIKISGPRNPFEKEEATEKIVWLKNIKKIKLIGEERGGYEPRKVYIIYGQPLKHITNLVFEIKIITFRRSKLSF